MVVLSPGLPSPPADDLKPTMSRKAMPSKSLKPSHRVSKLSSIISGGGHSDHMAHSVAMDGRHKRVWKACERCRMKKTKCDGEFPCKRCKDDGLVCAAGVRKKMEYKQLPKGYAEVLEHTQFALIATVHKLYSMVRNNQSWEYGEPELNDHGEPVIHNIAQKLGCIRPNSDIDLPVHSVFPEDRAGMAELARQLEEQQQQQAEVPHIKQESPSSGSPTYNHTDRASSSELDYSDFEFSNYRRAAFGSHTSSNPLTMSPQSLASSLDFDFSNHPTPPEMPVNTGLYPAQSPVMANFPDWAMSKTAQLQQDELAMNLMRQPALMQNLHNRALIESVDFSIMKPNMLSACANPGLMMGMADPTIYAGYQDDAMTM